EGFANTATGAVALISNTTGSGNTATGSIALIQNIRGSDNTAIGTFALGNNISGSQNTAVGAGANVSASDLTNATAIGANAVVSQSNSLVLGSNAAVGIGTSAPTNRLHVVNAIFAFADPENHVALIENNHPGAAGDQDVLALKITNVATPGAANNFITFFGSGGGT